MKNNRFGQAAILSNSDYSKIRKQINNQKFQVLFDLAYYTGERWGALVQVQTEDLWEMGIIKLLLNPSPTPNAKFGIGFDCV